MGHTIVRIRGRGPGEDAWVREVLAAGWGSPEVVSRGRVHRADALPGLVAELDQRAAGLLTYEIAAGELEVVTLQALLPRRGVGTALLAAARQLAAEAGCRRLWLVTTNDNASAIAFHAGAGLVLAAVHAGALARSRRLKPTIPRIGRGGTPIEDELEFELSISP